MMAVNGELGDNARKVDVLSQYCPQWMYYPSIVPSENSSSLPPLNSPPFEMFA
jgi:hypothetical protein